MTFIAEPYKVKLELWNVQIENIIEELQRVPHNLYEFLNYEILIDKLKTALDRDSISTRSEHKVQCDDCKRTYDFMEVDRCLDGKWRCEQCIAERKAIAEDSIKDGEDSTKNGIDNSQQNNSTNLLNEIESADIHSQIKKELDGDYVNKI